MSSVFSALMESPFLLGPWPEHARRVHSSITPEDEADEEDSLRGMNLIDINAHRARVIDGRAGQIESIVRERGQITAGELAQIVGCSRRSVYRYVARLVEAGSPVVWNQVVGYRWEPKQ